MLTIIDIICIYCCPRIGVLTSNERLLVDYDARVGSYLSCRLNWAYSRIQIIACLLFRSFLGCI